MNDGSSSAKTMDEKELFLMKTAAEGHPKYSVMSLEEPENAHAEGLKRAMENSFEKLNLIPPSEKQIIRYVHRRCKCKCRATSSG